MRKKAISLYIIFIILHLLIGCDNPVDNKYDSLPDLNRYDAIFVGEYHNMKENFDIELYLMKYYYSFGVRDFLFEFGYGHTLLLQYYIETGDEECLQVLFKNIKGTAACNQEAYKFFKDIYSWNSTLDEKIKLYGFDVEHQYSTGIAAIWFFILKKYNRIEGIPSITTLGTRADLINDFKNNKYRYSIINEDDKLLFERLILSSEQAEIYYQNRYINNNVRELYMIDNLREFISNNKNKIFFAIMGLAHSSLTGNAIDTSTNKYTQIPCLANVLKNEIKIASIALRQNPKPIEWPYTIKINENLRTTSYESVYNGNWPYY